MDRSHLNAFQCYCLRRILRIPPSFVSRISNAEVLGRSRQIQYSALLEQRQIRLYQKVQSMPVENMLRRLVCDLNGNPKQWHVRRSRGRPQQRWAQSVFKLICPDPILSCDRIARNFPPRIVNIRGYTRNLGNVPVHRPFNDNWWLLCVWIIHLNAKHLFGIDVMFY